MDLADGGNPMAEIALALSMAFFSILVLALVSMRAGDGAAAAGMTLAAAAAAPAPVEQTVLVHWQGRLLDTALHPVSIDDLPAGPLVLAVAPDLPVADAVALRQRFAGRDLTVTALDARWLARLKESTR
jgi:hypothetical protein